MTPFKKIRLFNEYGNGDLFSTREFVKELVSSHPEIQIEYSHGKHERMFLDIDNLKYSRPDNNCDNSKDVYYIDDTLYVNTWVGHNKKYVTAKNTVSITNVKLLFNDKLGFFHKFNNNINDYIPKIDFSKFHIEHIDKFISSRRQSPLILIVNCIAQSGQAFNFNFDPVIARLCDEFPGFDFIVTNETAVERKNLYTTRSIIQSPYDFDLNEISYLSTYCNPIIGRGSGAYCFAMNRENSLGMSPQKYFIGFTYDPMGSDLLFGQEKSCIVLSNKETDTTLVGDYISRIIRG